MAFQTIKAVTWNPLDPVTAAKLNDMTNNDNMLQENMVRGVYSAASVRKEQGVRIASGLQLMSIKKAQSAAQRVSFGNFFSQGCSPVVSTGVFSKSQRDIMLTMSGPGATAILPDRNGFDAHAFLTKKATCSFYVSWIAVGW